MVSVTRPGNAWEDSPMVGFMMRNHLGIDFIKLVGLECLNGQHAHDFVVLADR